MSKNLGWHQNNAGSRPQSPQLSIMIALTSPPLSIAQQPPSIMSEDGNRLSQDQDDVLGQRLNALSLSPNLGDPKLVPQALFGTRNTTSTLRPNARILATGGKKKVIIWKEGYEIQLEAIEKAVTARRKYIGICYLLLI